VPNNRMAVCSKILERQLIRSYIERRWRPDEIVVCSVTTGPNPSATRRASSPGQPYRIASPLLSPPYWQKGDFDAWRERRHIEPPTPVLHRCASCQSAAVLACVAGQVEWKRLLRWNRDRYLEWEADEEQTRDCSARTWLSCVTAPVLKRPPSSIASLPRGY